MVTARGIPDAPLVPREDLTTRTHAIAATSALLARLAGCATPMAGIATAESAPARAVNEARLQPHLDQVGELYAAELGSSFPWTRWRGTTPRSPAGRCAQQWRPRVAPEGAYAAAFPAVAAAGNVDDLRDGPLADMILCPAR